MNWQLVMGDGFGDPGNVKVESLANFNRMLYAAPYNTTTGMGLWASAGGTDWSQAITDGYGDSPNFSTLWSNATLPYRRAFLMGTWNYVTGGEIW